MPIVVAVSVQEHEEMYILPGADAVCILSRQRGGTLVYGIKGGRVARNITPTADVDTLVTGISAATDGEPPLLQTYVNGGALHGRSEQYATLEIADDGHDRVLMEVAEEEECRCYW